jgi:hypothetical protein
MAGVPKIIDYAGRFAFFELACFALVRDHGVDRLSRHGVARVLGTSISTVRRLLSPEADLRQLALNEVGVRRRTRLRGRPTGTGVDAGLTLLRPHLPDDPAHIAEELVWWRLVVAAPSTADVPGDHEDEDEEGPLHHRFSIATHGFVHNDVLNAQIEPPRRAITPDGEIDPVVAARVDRHDDLALRARLVVRTVAPELADDVAAGQARVLHALVEGLGVSACTGDLRPDEVLEVVRTHLATLPLLPPR